MARFFEILSHCMYQSIRYPRTQIMQVGNPTNIEVSPIPWWGTGLVLVLGISSWCVSEYWVITGLAEASRLMVYCSLTHLFDMTWFLSKGSNKGSGKGSGKGGI